MPISTNSDLAAPGFLEKASNASAACPMIRKCLSYNIAQTHSRKFIESSTTKTAKRSILGRRYPRILGFASSYIDRYTGRCDPKLFPIASSNQRSTKRSRDRPRLGVAYCHEMVRPRGKACGEPARRWSTSERLPARSLFELASARIFQVEIAQNTDLNATYGS